MLNWLYTIVTKVLLGIHSGLSPIFGADSGAAWGLSVVLLTVAVRLILFPLFVKQVRSQRAMQDLAPEVKALQAKFKGDRERMNQEVMALYRERGANPLMGCLPLVLQMPFFWALFHVLKYLTHTHSHYEYGWTQSLVDSASHASVFGVPLGVGFLTKATDVRAFGADPSLVKIVVPIGIVLMATTTFLTQRQMIARNAASGNPMANQQKMLMYVLPPMFALFGFGFPMGVLLYWVTSNVWSMGQQFFVLRKIHASADAGGSGGGKGAGAGGGKGGKGGGELATEPTVTIRRQQRTRQPRSKRSGSRSGQSRGSGKR